MSRNIKFLAVISKRAARQRLILPATALIWPLTSTVGCNERISELGSEQGAKVAQNVVAGVAGLFIPVLWFGMDFQGAAGTEQAALQGRQQYLASLAGERCGGPEGLPPVMPNMAQRSP